MTEPPIWSPSPERIASTGLAAFMERAGGFRSFEDLHRWSLADKAAFWRLVWDFGEVRGAREGPVLVDAERMPGATWFPQARLNFAENLLRSSDDRTACVFWGEDRVKRRLSMRELSALVARIAEALRTNGVVKGDRVAGYLPNLPEAVAAMLATASLGAIWSSCSPDFGVQGVLDRFGQIEPKVFICCDRYLYGGKEFDLGEKNAAILAGLPGVRARLLVRYFDGSIEGVAPTAAQAPEFESLAFDHPLYILYSSGTTGVPKCIVHGTGGMLLQHIKEHRLHSDIRRGDRVFYFTTLGWMMWNWLVSALASEATLLLYDGSPFLSRGRILFDYADAEGMTHLGTSAKYIDAIAKLNLRPRATHRLESLRVLLSTGSPLVAEGFDYVYSNIKGDLCLSSISGGTDIASCFVLGNPAGPVWRGEIQAKGLGLAVEVFDDDGRSIVGEKGELVCTQPFPAMPVGFWNDADGSRYKAAYFEQYPDVWRHGDWCELTSHGGMVIYGRSDAVLNPGGVRIGTAEIYRQVEQLDEVVESIVIGQDWRGEVRMVLFVKLREGARLDERLISRIKQQIRGNTTPRHVPDKIVAVSDIPRTKSGKIVELAVRDVVHGREVRNREALANPEALEHFRNRAELAN